MPPSYSEAADDDLRAIYRASVAMFGVTQAERYVAMLRRVCRPIGDFPRFAPERMEIVPPIRARSATSHVIICQVDADDRVLILRFRHVREDWMADPING